MNWAKKRGAYQNFNVLCFEAFLKFLHDMVFGWHGLKGNVLYMESLVVCEKTSVHVLFTSFSPRLPRNLMTAHFTNCTTTSESSGLSRIVAILSSKFAFSKKDNPAEVVAIYIVVSIAKKKRRDGRSNVYRNPYLVQEFNCVYLYKEIVWLKLFYKDRQKAWWFACVKCAVRVGGYFDDQIVDSETDDTVAARQTVSKMAIIHSARESLHLQQLLQHGSTGGAKERSLSWWGCWNLVQEVAGLVCSASILKCNCSKHQRENLRINHIGYKCIWC